MWLERSCWRGNSRGPILPSEGWNTSPEWAASWWATAAPSARPSGRRLRPGRSRSGGGGAAAGGTSGCRGRGRPTAPRRTWLRRGTGGAGEPATPAQRDHRARGRDRVGERDRPPVAAVRSLLLDRDLAPEVRRRAAISSAARRSPSDADARSNAASSWIASRQPSGLSLLVCTLRTKSKSDARRLTVGSAGGRRRAATVRYKARSRAAYVSRCGRYDDQIATRSKRQVSLCSDVVVPNS